MSSINPLRFGVTGNNYYKQEPQEENLQSGVKDEKSSQQKESNVNSSTVLNYMAAQNSDIVPAATKKTIEVSKYVSPEQEARITSFIKGFESDYNDVYEAAGDEFPGISDGAASQLALAYINSAYEK